VSRRNLLLVWVGIVLALLLLFYACSPWLLASAIRHELALRGGRDIRVSVEYPQWSSLRVHAIAFTAHAGGNRIASQIPEIVIEYRLSDLVRGRISTINIPLAALHIQPLASKAPAPGSSPATLPLTALISGQWLAQLPIKKMSLQRLDLDWAPGANAKYAMRLHAQLQAGSMQAGGQLQGPWLAKPLTFTLAAQDTGVAKLLVFGEEDAAKPLLQAKVNSVVSDQEITTVKGAFNLQLTPLPAMLAPHWPDIKSLAGITGNLNADWQARLEDSYWRLTGEAVVPKLAGAHWQKLALPETEIQAGFAANAQQVTLHATVRAAARALVLHAQGVHRLATGAGYVDIDLQPLKFSESGFRLSQLLDAWPYPFDVRAGQVSAKASLGWNRRVNSTVAIHLDHLGGYYKKIRFNGLSGDAELALRNGIATRKDVQLHMDALNVGFPVKNTRVQFALAPAAGSELPVIRIQHFSARLLGGLMRSNPFALDFSRERNAFIVQLEHIDLNEIMQLEQQQGLQGSGRLDGQIPITITRAGIAVSKGRLAARVPGGVIRYSPTEKVLALAKSNSNVDMLVRTLSNYHYRVLQVHSDYRPTGELSLQVHLEGRNPDWQAGKPLHLNLNLQENIPVLLRSLQLSEDISEQLRRHYQSP